MYDFLYLQVLAGNPEDLYPDGRYNHILQVQERLNFLRFLLKGTTILFYINLTDFFPIPETELENLVSINYFLTIYSKGKNFLN